MINSSGGMTGGDRIDWDFQVGENAGLTVTTQACERVYKSPSDTAVTEIKLKVGEQAQLSWLPQETIVFDQSALRRTITAELSDGAELLLVEPLLIGRKAMDETIRKAHFSDRWRIHRDGVLVHAEDFRLTGSVDETLNQAAVAGGQVAMATALLVAPRGEALLDEARSVIGELGSASFWNGKLLARLIAEDGYRLRQRLVPLIKLLNPSATLPKIWST